MSLFFSHPRVGDRPSIVDIRSLAERLWQTHLDRKSARDSLDRLLARGDDHLLQDVGVDRATAHRLLGETVVVPHRAWDRWQL